MRQAPEEKKFSSEPGASPDDVGGFKFLIALRQIQDPFHQPDDGCDETQHPAGNQSDQQEDDSLLVVAEIKLVNSERSQENGENCKR